MVGPEGSLQSAGEPIGDPEREWARWADHRVEQFGFTHNLLLALAGGGLAFLATQLEYDWREPRNLLILLGMLFLAASMAWGVWLALNRLYDFRWTALAHRRRLEGRSDEGRELLARADRLGKRSWSLLWAQVVSWALGVLHMTAGFLVPPGPA